MNRATLMVDEAPGFLRTARSRRLKPAAQIVAEWVKHDTSAMRITLNGQADTVTDGASVRDLLDRLELEPVRVAVEINEDIVPRRTFAEHTIHEGDRIEIVTFVGGG